MKVIHPYISQKEKMVLTNKYLQEIKPLLLILRVFGRFPFLFENGQVVFKPLSWPVLYTLFLVLLQLFVTYYNLGTLISNLSTQGNFDDSLYCLALVFSSFQSLTVPITFCLESSRALGYINNWYYFQEEFGKDNLNFSLTRLIKITCMIHVPVMISMLVGGAYIFNDYRAAIFSLSVIALATLSAELLLWIITLHELRTASDKLLKRIIAGGCRNMYQFRILWLKISNLTTDVGESFGHTGLGVSVLLFSTFVLTTYGLLSLAIDRSFTKSFCALLCTSLFCMSVQFIMCDAAHRTNQAVGEKFSSKLLELSTSSLSHRDQFEMNFLLQAMMTNPPVIHFLGYMVIDRTLFVKFISDTVTYLVVLIQLKSS